MWSHKREGIRGSAGGCFCMFLDPLNTAQIYFNMNPRGISKPRDRDLELPDRDGIWSAVPRLCRGNAYQISALSDNSKHQAQALK